MTMKTNGIGKIRRLPRVARERLNQRIEDGEPAAVLVEWLNSLPVTQGIVSDYFDERAITEQNLCVAVGWVCGVAAESGEARVDAGVFVGGGGAGGGDQGGEKG